MKWVIIKGVRYPNSVISAFAAYNMDNPFLKVRIRNKYHIVSFDDVNKMASQMVYLMNNYPDFVEIGRWWISKKTVMSWIPKGKAVDGSGWVISFTLSFGFNKNECEGLLDKNGLNDKMDVFINRLFNENNHIRYLKDIGYHKIGSIFKYNTGMEKIELEVIEIDDSSCDGCVFNNRGYYCMYSCCCNIDREDNTDVIYKEVKRS